MNRRISLKLCTQVKEQILRTFSCWHFSEKNVLHGFFWVFLVFSHLSHLWLINHRIKGHFQHEGMPVAAKCTFMKIINGQRSFERSKKIFPRGHPKCRKVPKYFFLFESFWWNCWFEQPERSARSQIIRVKIVSVQWLFQKYSWFACRGCNKKIDFWVIWHVEWLDENYP